MSNLISGKFPAKTYRNLNVQTTGSIVKAAKGQVFDIHVSNQAGATRYLKFYDKATAPTASDTPIRTYALPASSITSLYTVEMGIEFLNGISIRGTQLLADNDNTAPSANDIVVNIGWL